MLVQLRELHAPAEELRWIFQESIQRLGRGVRARGASCARPAARILPILRPARRRCDAGAGWVGGAILIEIQLGEREIDREIAGASRRVRFEPLVARFP